MHDASPLGVPSVQQLQGSSLRSPVPRPLLVNHVRPKRRLHDLPAVPAEKQRAKGVATPRGGPTLEQLLQEYEERWPGLGGRVGGSTPAPKQAAAALKRAAQHALSLPRAARELRVSAS